MNAAPTAPAVVAPIGLVDGTEACRARVDAARREGPRAIVGRLGRVDDGALALLAARGLTHVVAELGGPTSAAHAYVLPDAAPFEDLLASARAARAHGIATIVETPLTRSSAPSLVDVARLAITLPALALVVRLPEAMPAPYPSLTLAVSHAVRALDVARRAHVLPLLVDAPRCLAGPFAPITVLRRARSYAPACGHCPARVSCAGLDPEAFGTALPGLSVDLDVPESVRSVARLAEAARIFAMRETA